MEEQKNLENSENINHINEGTLYYFITELIKTDSNIFIYGYGSKLKLIYDYIKHFQEKVNGQDGINYHILIFNCFNPEINLKFILNEIQGYIFKILSDLGLSNKDLVTVLNKNKTLEGQIFAIKQLLDLCHTNEFSGKFLLVINNIDGPNFQNKFFQSIISQLINTTDFIFLTTSDNLYVNYFWTQNIKDYFSFYFLKYHTLVPYDYEISERNSLTGEKSIKRGAGLAQILKSFSTNQKELIKIMAQVQIKNNMEKMTAQALVDFMVDEGYGVCNNLNQFTDLIHEPLDHGIVITKTLPKNNNKEYYKVNLEIDVLQKIAEGVFDADDLQNN